MEVFVDSRRYKGIRGGQKAFIKNLLSEMERKGYPLKADRNLFEYNDFFNRVSISVNSEGGELRLDFVFDMPTVYLALIACGFMLNVLIGIAVASLWYLKHRSLRDNFTSSIDSAAELHGGRRTS